MMQLITKCVQSTRYIFKWILNGGPDSYRDWSLDGFLERELIQHPKEEKAKASDKGTGREEAKASDLRKGKSNIQRPTSNLQSKVTKITCNDDNCFPHLMTVKVIWP